MQMLGNFEVKRNLYFIYFAPSCPENVPAPLGKWRHVRQGAGLGGTSTHFTQPFKNVFLRINLDQNMRENVRVFEKKSSLIATASGDLPLNPR